MVRRRRLVRGHQATVGERVAQGPEAASYRHRTLGSGTYAEGIDGVRQVQRLGLRVRAGHWARLGRAWCGEWAGLLVGCTGMREERSDRLGWLREIGPRLDGFILFPFFYFSFSLLFCKRFLNKFLIEFSTTFSTQLNP